MAWEEKACCEEFDLHANIYNLGSGFLATDYISLSLKSRHSRPKHETKQTYSYIHVYRSLVCILYATTGLF